jgi:hypothetical protein
MFPKRMIRSWKVFRLLTFRVSVIAAHAKKKRELRDELPIFSNNIILKISVASQLLIEADGERAATKAVEDPNALVAIVHRTLFSYVGGATPVMAKINMQKSYNALEQGPSRSISEFKKESDTLMRCMRGADIPEMDRKTSAICFFGKARSSSARRSGIAPYQWQDCRTSLFGHRRRGLHYSKELEEFLRSSRRLARNHYQRSSV